MANYTYPGTDTVKNNFGETDFAKFERREGRSVAARQVEIEAGYGPKGQFNADHLSWALAIFERAFERNVP